MVLWNQIIIILQIMDPKEWMESASVGVALFGIRYKIGSDDLKDQRIKQALAFDLSTIQS